MDTLCVNLYGGPGSGKSTTAAHTFAMLKHRGITTELVTEVAKDLVWEGLYDHLRMRGLYIFAEQMYRIERLLGKVEVIVTDSPILLCVVYAKDEPPAFDEMVFSEYRKLNNLNYFIRRVKPYSPRGRMQSEAEAIELDTKILELLKGFPFQGLDGNHVAAEKIVSSVMERRHATQTATSGS